MIRDVRSLCPERVLPVSGIEIHRISDYHYNLKILWNVYRRDFTLVGGLSRRSEPGGRLLLELSVV